MKYQCWRLTHCGFQRLTERSGLIRRHLHDQPAATLEWDAHDDATAFFGDLQRSVAGPWLHGRHVVSPPSNAWAHALSRPSGKTGVPRLRHVVPVVDFP